MIYDCVLFNDECDMLEFRMKLLDNYVDKFVIVEADRTFSGQSKPSHFWDNRERYSKWMHKVVHFRISVATDGMDFSNRPSTYDPKHACWQIEYLQRNAIAEALRSQHMKPEDVILISDTDEIPSRKALEWAGEWLTADGLTVCRMKFFYYNLLNLRAEHWSGTIITTWRMLQETTPQAMRDKRGGIPFLIDGGWHLSNFGGADYIIKKIQSFSHQEYNTEEFTDPAHVKACIETGADLFKRPVANISVTPAYFPGYFRDAAKGYGWGI